MDPKLLKLVESICACREFRQFEQQYRVCKTREGSSVGPQRRNVIDWGISNNKCTYVSLPQKMELERYFNDLFGLCPYGLEDNPVTTIAQPEEPSNIEITNHEFLINQLPKETIMPTNQSVVSLVSNVTFIGDKPATNFTDAEIFNMIANREQKIETLNKIQNKPKKLTQAIEAIQADIDALVKLVDERE